MSNVLKIDGARSEMCQEYSMAEADLNETEHLEQWIVDHPELIDESMIIVTTQFNRWAAKEATATERLDVLGLASDGTLVVIELKSVRDKSVHLQALTYGALVSSFTLRQLAEAHAAWLNKDKTEDADTVRPEQTLEILRNHLELEPEQPDPIFALPKIVLVAPSFPAQVLTTVQWLQEIAPELTIECHTYRIINVATRDDTEAASFQNLVASFNRLFPVMDIDAYRLRAQSPRIQEAVDQKIRKANVVDLILAGDLLPDGAALAFHPAREHQGKAEAVERWLDEDPSRREFSWDAGSAKPFVWGCEPEKRWSSAKLVKEIFTRAGQAIAGPGTRAWAYEGRSLPDIAYGRD